MLPAREPEQSAPADSVASTTSVRQSITCTKAVIGSLRSLRWTRPRAEPSPQSDSRQRDRAAKRRRRTASPPTPPFPAPARTAWADARETSPTRVCLVRQLAHLGVL